MAIRNVILVVLLLVCFQGKSQSRRFKYLTSADGISQSEVYTFLEDSRGFIWFGTVDGLNKYDGYHIEIFNTNINDPHSLSNNTIRSLAEDNLGRIWIGTDDGLNMYDPKTEQIDRFVIDSLENRFAIWSLYIQENVLFVGTGNGLWKTNIQSNDIEKIENQFRRVTQFSNKAEPDYAIRALVNSNSGGIWIITVSSVSRVIFQQDNGSPVIIEDISFSDFGNHRAAIEDSLGNLWVASNSDGLLRYNPKNKTTDYYIADGTLYTPSSKKCSSLAADKEGNLWIGTIDRGLNFVNSEELHNKKMYFKPVTNESFNENGLNSNLIYSMYISHDNLLWVGTIGAGVNIYNPEQKKFIHFKFQNLYNDNLSNSNFIRSVYSDHDGHIWTGTHGNGLFLLNREEYEFQKLGFETLSIFYIHPYKENKKFICSGAGLHLVEMNNQEFKILNNNYLENAAFYITQSTENVYWLATLNGLRRLKLENNNIINDLRYFDNSEPAISQNNCRVLFYDETKNMLYVGTEGGGLNVAKLNADQFPEEIKVYQKNKEVTSLSNNYVRSIIKDYNNNIWIGTYEGLNKMITDSVTGEFVFKRYTKNDGLPNNMIQLLVEDNNNNLWIGTNGGLSQFIPEEERFINYTVNDGIQSNEFSEHTVFKKQDGEIIMGGINGITAFYPDQIQISRLNPKTTITGFYLFNERVHANQKVGKKAPLNESITLTDSIVLLPKQKNIGFEFSAMIYPNAEKIRYAYKLEGFDDDWQYTDAGNRIANYTNLRHGKYIFKVKSTNPDGIWEETSTDLFLHIQTPFIYTWAAYIIYFLLIALVFIYFSHFTIIRYTTKKKLLLEKAHNEKVHELDVLRTKFFINISHDLRTPLTLIRGPLDVLLQNKTLNQQVKEHLLLIKRNVKRLNYLIEQLLDVRKSESGKLSAELESQDIVSFTKEEVAHFSYAIQQKGLRLMVSCNSEKIYVCFDKAMLAKVYFNVISNAIKYTDKGEIKIIIEKVNKNQFPKLKDFPADSFVKVQISDTGTGIPKEQIEKIFDRFYQDRKHSGKGYGIGLSHTKELIDAHNGFIEVQSEKNQGTTIRFFLPDTEIITNKENKSIGSTEDIYVDNETSGIYEDENVSGSAKKILIVEDNADMRNFIKSELKTDYKVIEARDGLEGLKQANDHMPDLIVCDVMMPNMNGIELCEKIKSNVETSHIPLILLTARVDMETKYKGIKIGADDYIPKPFEKDYLIIRIKNLLESRQKLREKFQKSNVLEPSAVTVTSVDEKFLSMLMKAINEGIPNSDFSINSLESQMAMSHAKFYRKIKSLTGQSGQELLLSMRMKRAHQILSEKKGLRIAEVAYMVGFTNPKYFSKCFKETYGVAPSELSK